ncbi:MAG TPA: hypothetical protein VF916_01395 [Ktedonobacterales bacterium]
MSHEIQKAIERAADELIALANTMHQPVPSAEFDRHVAQELRRIAAELKAAAAAEQ